MFSSHINSMSFNFTCFVLFWVCELKEKCSAKTTAKSSNSVPLAWRSERRRDVSFIYYWLKQTTTKSQASQSIEKYLTCERKEEKLWKRKFVVDCGQLSNSTLGSHLVCHEFVIDNFIYSPCSLQLNSIYRSQIVSDDYSVRMSQHWTLSTLFIII